MSKPNAKHSDVLAVIRNLGTVQCGEDAAKHFAFGEGYLNLNHGSYGTHPVVIRNVLRHYQESFEARPDAFIRYEHRTRLLDAAREVIAKYLHAPPETCVYVRNASTGIDTVLRNLVYEPGDVIICFTTVYEAFDNTLQYLTETTPAEVKKIDITHPVSDRHVCDAFETTIKDLRDQCKRPRIAIFDTISSRPGVRMPFEHLIELCASYNILSCVDGAHGAGQIELHLQDLDPDFFVSNCHKWLYVPRGCAAFYVPVRNQHLLRATFPVGFGFVPQSGRAEGTHFIRNFAYLGTEDDTPYLCVEAALIWRSKLEWNGMRGEEAIMTYMQELARKGGQTVSTILGTEVLDNEERSLSRCALTNVRLPLSIVDLTSGDMAKAEEIGKWIMQRMTLDHGTAVNVFLYADALWAGLCAQVYLTEEDFERAGGEIQATCEEVMRCEWKQIRKPS